MTPKELLELTVDWYSTAEDPYVYTAVVNGVTYRLRLNDFPQEPLCTLFTSAGQYDLNSFGRQWRLPKHRLARSDSNQDSGH